MGNTARGALAAEDGAFRIAGVPAGAVERVTVRRLAVLPSALIAELVVAGVGVGVVVGVAGGGGSTATGGRPGGQGGRQ